MPPRVRIIQAADVDAWQRVLVALACAGETLGRAVILPTRQAAEQLRRTCEHDVLRGGTPVPRDLAACLGLPPDAAPPDRALILPRLLTRDDWYAVLHASLEGVGPLLPTMSREVMMMAAARHQVARGTPPTFLVRPGLVAEMLAFHDVLCRLGQEPAGTGAHLAAELEGEAAADHGAARLLGQTQFLFAAFETYRGLLRASGGLDEQGLRGASALADASTGIAHLVVATGDHHASREGLWPADVDLLGRLHELQRVDVVCTERDAAAGLVRRLVDLWPRANVVRVDAQRPPTTQLEVPAGPALWFACRDREEEVLAVVRRLKADPPDDIATTAIVYRRPLPYLYLARHLFDTAGIPCEAQETLPLAAEPWAAAIDVLMDCVLADATRATLVAVLRHPHLTFEDDQGVPLTPEAIAAFDRLLARDRYLGGHQRLERVVDGWAEGRTSGDRRDLRDGMRVGGAAVTLVRACAPWRRVAPAARHLEHLTRLLAVHARPVTGDDDTVERERRARAGIDHVVRTLTDACDAYDATPVAARDVFAVLRRWIEERTFAPARDRGGVQVLDASAARFGRFTRIRLVGLVEGEWPEASARNVFYPAFMLARLGWPDERVRTAAARASFADLLALPSGRVGVSAPQLEQDAIVRPSGLLDELRRFPVSAHAPVPADEHAMAVTLEGALLATPIVAGAFARVPHAAAALAWRLGRGPRAEPGRTDPVPATRYGVTAVERYLQCPFRYFAASVLRVQEEPDDEAGLPSRDAGIFVHDVLHACYDAWQARGHVRIDAADLPEARSVFGQVAEQALQRLPTDDRPFERLRLFGSSVTSGLIEKVLRVEVESFGDVARRQLEVDLDGTFVLPGSAGPRDVMLRGRVDRVDHTITGAVRVVDYKSGRRPYPEAVQPGVYATCLAQKTDEDGAPAIAPSGYVALREVAPWVPTARDAAAARTQAAAFTDAVAAIEAGRFDVRPVNEFRCRFCEFGSVCRKDYVGDE
jgi:RecB family exonuclease